MFADPGESTRKELILITRIPEVIKINCDHCKDLCTPLNRILDATVKVTHIVVVERIPTTVVTDYDLCDKCWKELSPSLNRIPQ